MHFKALCRRPRMRSLLTKTIRIMRITSFLLLAACLQVSASGYAQRITLKEKDAPLAKLFSSIEAQTGYSFAYTGTELSQSRTVTIDITDASLDQVLAICFRDQPFTYTVIEKTIVIEPRPVPIGEAQPAPPSTDIHGRITDSLGNPLAGASITVKGTHRIATTDANGEFTMKDVRADAVIVVSYIGYSTKELPLKGKKEISLSLRIASAQLGDVEVVYSNGYQNIPKDRSTGSFDILDKATINQQVGSNILDRIVGVASGVISVKQQTLANGPSTGLLIRGFSTINGPTDPLIVVDNFPYDGNINNINPNDVESITILKDAGAASIWGVRAGNGVIVITTKKGHFNRGLQVNFNANVIVSQIPNLHKLRTISSGDYIDLEKTLFNNGFYSSYLSNNYNYPALSPVVEALNNEQTGLITAAQANSQIDALRMVDTRDEYAKYFYQKAVTQQYAVNMQGGSQAMNYYLSAGYDKSVDQLGSPSDRATVKIDNTYRPASWLTLTAGAQYTQTNGGSGKPGFGSIRVGNGNPGWVIPYLPFADQNGRPLAVAGTYRQGYVDTAGQGLLLNWNYYPLEDWKHNYSTSVSRDVLANLGLNFSILPGLSFDLKYLYEHQTVDTRQVSDTASFYARNLINMFSQVNNGSVSYIVPVGNILNLLTTSIESQNERGQLNFSKKTRRSDLTLLAGGEIRQTHGTGYSAATVYGYNNNLAFTNVNFNSSYPINPGGGYQTIPNNEGFSDRLNRYVSIYANGAYTFNGKYTLTLSGRRDASNLFGVATDHKWNPLWSGGLGWLLSNEPFYHIAALPFLKFRGTYGFSGNVNPSASAVTTANFEGNLYPSNYTAAIVYQFPNPELKWETVRMTNLGLDFETAHKLFSGTVELYFKQGFNLFGPTPVDPTLGLNGNFTVTKNVADMKGRGIDVTLNTKIIDRAFKWTNTLLFSYNKSITSKYYSDSTFSASSYVNYGNLIDPLVGQPLYAVVVFKYGGLDGSGNPQGYLNKGLTENYDSLTQMTPRKDLVYKSSLPVVFGSFSNTFSWKSFQLVANISYRLGYYFVKPSLSYNQLYNGGAYVGSQDYTKRWQQPGDEKRTNVPSAIYPIPDENRDNFYISSTAVVDKADNIKLQYVNLSYDLDKKQLPFLPFPHLQIYVNVSNLGIIWKANKDGIDPDFLTSPESRKTYAFGVRTSF
jgi:TonB-linked SusC/RagA family outer membrane protein